MFNKISNFFPAPKFLNFPFFGLAISDSVVRCLQFESRNNKLYIKKYAEKSIPPGAVVFGQINDEKALIEVLKSLKNEQNITYAKVSLPEEKGYLFASKIPKVKPKEVRGVIESKMEESVPVPPSELLFDYKIVDYSQKDHFDVVVSALPLDIINLYVEIFDKVGISLLSLEIESQAIVRSLLPEKTQGDIDTVIVVNMGSASVGLYVAVDRVVHFTSTVSLKEEYAKTEEYLAQEIKKIFLYWHTLKHNFNNPKRKIKKIIVCGEGFNDNILSQISTVNQTPVIPGNVWTNAFDINTNVPEISFKDSLKYATSIGLALPTDFLIQN